MATPQPSQETFEKLLIVLSADRDRAGEEYELLRLKLLKYFRSRALLHAEELADETLNRLAKKIDEGEEIRDVLRYSHGLAHYVWMEHLKKPDARPVPYDELPLTPFTLSDPVIRKERDDCCQYCLQLLPEGDRELITEYWIHGNQKHRDARRELAERLRISLTALRIRVSRIKDKLENCFSDCLDKGVSKMKRS